MMLNISSHARYFLLMGTLLGGNFFACSAALAERCEPAPDNEYEKILCDLKRSSRGAGLPNIYQFRENTPLTQALLLKKPAERAGIIVKIPERDNEQTLRRQEDLLMPEATAQKQEPLHLRPAVTTVAIIQQQQVRPQAQQQPIAQTQPVVQTKTVDLLSKVAVDVPSTVTKKETVVVNAINAEVVKAPAASAPVVNVVADISLAACSLQQLTLQCTDGRYQLAGNKTNQQLSDKALSEDHKLGLPVYSGSATDEQALNDYLANAYDRYLEGMLEIGLGASTMSYTKFANLYHYIVEQHLDFSARFETMYTFLKKDKAAIGVSTKLAIADGFTLENCSQLTNLIACDYQKNNYVFSKLDSTNPQ